MSVDSLPSMESWLELGLAPPLCPLVYGPQLDPWDFWLALSALGGGGVSLGFAEGDHHHHRN